MEFVDNVTPDFSGFYPQQLENQNRWMPGKNNREADNWLQWAQLYYPNAFQAAMLNYQNDYDRPLNQMLRWQEAGLNQYAFQPMQSNSGSQGSKPGTDMPRQQLTQQKISNALKAVSTTMDAVKVATEIYDYLNYGKDKSFYEVGMARYNAEAAKSLADSRAAEAAWNNYWNLGVDSYDSVNGKPLSQSPRAKYMEASTNRINAQIAQLESIVDTLYPSQVEANEARAALQRYQKSLLEGNYDAVLQIDTGNKTADSILMMLALKLLNTNLSLGVKL